MNEDWLAALPLLCPQPACPGLAPPSSLLPVSASFPLPPGSTHGCHSHAASHSWDQAQDGRDTRQAEEARLHRERGPRAASLLCSPAV